MPVPRPGALAAGGAHGTRDLNRNVLFQQFFNSVADRGREVLRRTRGSDEDDFVQLSRSLLAQRGEATAAALGQTLVETTAGLDEDARLRFFQYLARELSPDGEAVLEAAEAYAADPDPAHLAALERAVEPPRQELFRRMNFAPGGTAALVRLRAELKDLVPDHPELAAVDNDLLHLFISWFNRGFLTLGRIDWGSPAALLEKLITYEAVHEIRGFQDLRRRLSADRRCFAFFHPALPEEPLVFVEVALTEGMVEGIAPLIDPARPELDPRAADSAIFYSISNCQKGLSGVTFGSFLIKQVAVELQNELPNLKVFATLSPVPGFTRWLRTLGPGEGDKGVRGILELIDRPGWSEDAATAGTIRPALIDLCAYYLIQARRPDGFPLDPVARFHLGNGAGLERINWLADPSPRGLERSAGLMVNYRYRLDRLEQNHEAYVNQKRVIAARAVEQAARRAPLKAAKPEAA